MSSAYRIGRVAGIDIGANWTWLVVLALFVWSLAGGVLPDTNPGLSSATYVVMGVVAALLFFASIVLTSSATRSRHAARAWRSAASRCGRSAASRASTARSRPRGRSCASRSLARP